MLAAGARRAPAGAICLGLLLTATFVVSLLLGRSLFSLYSINHDDAMYVYVARLLGDGDLTLPADEQDFLTPWASGVRDDRVVMKYAPPWPAVLAASQGLTGSTALASAAVAAAAAGLVYLLAREVLASRRVALLAAAAFALSPIALIQSGTALPYMFQLVTGLGFAVALLAGLRREQRGLLALAGVALGVGVFARPFDAVLFALPFLAVLAWRRRRDHRDLARTLGVVAAGAAPVMALSLLYNAHTMGSPLRLPFTVTGPSDTMGFGRRGVFPSSAITFTPGDGVEGLAENLRWLPSWSFGGVVTVVLAGVAIAVTLRRGVHRTPWVGALVGIAVTTCVGYFAFWSPFAMASLWPGVQTLGPYYHLALLVPLAILGAYGLDVLWRGSPRSRALGAAGVVVGVALTVAGLPPKLEANADVKADYAAVGDLVDGLGLTNAVLVMPDRGPEGFQSPAPFLENRPDLDQPVLYAEDRGAENFALFDRYPDRAIHQLVQQHEPDDQLMHPSLVPTRLWLEQGDQLALDVGVRNPTDHPRVVAYVDDGETRREVVLDEASTRGDEYAVSWALTSPDVEAVRAAGTAAGPRRFAPRPTDAGMLTIGVEVGDAATVDRTLGWERRIPYRVVDGQLQLMRPGAGVELFAYGERRWIPTDVDDVLAEGDLATPR